jgi:type II secretory pathway component GspD/PulD (secretin)
MRTFQLANIAQQNDANEILVALRNMLDPYVKIYLVASENAIVIDAAPDQLALAERLIHELDKPKKTYKLTYTVTDVDNGRTVGAQHYSMIIVGGQHTTLKQGSKIPVATGSYSTDHNASQTQFTYLDVGMNFDASLIEMGDGGLLKSKVEESNLGEPSTIAGVTEPVVRQTVLEGTASLTLNKPQTLGSVDITGTTHRLDIVVTMQIAP